ncbi:MAG: hypothetical protein K2I35_00740 [Duncaniella sp.]|nr:hypothetical protein [Duncaniella sp.]
MVGAFAQTQDENRVYCELVGSSGLFSSKVKVTIDFGQETSFWKGSKDQQLVDADGNDIKFNSMVDAMNFMGKNGWKFVQAYTIGDGKNGYVYRWLLYKDVKDDSEVLEGFMTKEQFKNK